MPTRRPTRAASQVPTYNRPYAFRKSCRLGDREILIISGEGKYYRGTSTLTIKFLVSCGDDGDDEDGGGWGFY